MAKPTEQRADSAGGCSLQRPCPAILAALQDPAAVWANMLRGTIARPQALDHYEECKARLEAAEIIIEDLIRACGSGMNWMDQVSRAKLGSATRGILTTDIGMCSSAIFKAQQFLEKAKPANDQALRPARSPEQKGNDGK